MSNNLIVQDLTSKLRICHIVVQNNPWVIVCAQKIIDIGRDSDAEEYVSGTGGSGGDNVEVEDRQTVIEIINSFVAAYPDGHPV